MTRFLYKSHQKSSVIYTKKSGHSALLERRKKENHAVIKICGYIFFSLSFFHFFLVKNFAACYKTKKKEPSINFSKNIFQSQFSLIFFDRADHRILQEKKSFPTKREGQHFLARKRWNNIRTRCFVGEGFFSFF